MWDIKAGVDVCHELLGQNTGVVEDAAEEPRTGEVGPELQQIRHPLPGCHGVQPDIGMANMYVFPGEVYKGDPSRDEGWEPCCRVEYILHVTTTLFCGSITIEYVINIVGVIR